MQIRELTDKGSATNMDGTLIATFEQRLNGRLIRPGDGAYDEARSLWNGMIDKYPALIAQCVDNNDVIACVNFARDNNIAMAIRGGGHNVAGTASCDGGLVIDLSSMRSVTVDPVARIARAEGGATIADLDRATQEYGLATPMGVVSETGIAGLTLGGGMGWLRRKYGLSCDNLIAAEIVTADGRLVRTNEHEQSDLFWGIRGGGGNFGVVTTFEFRLHEVGPEVAFVGAMYPQERASELLPVWRDFMDNAPDEISSQALFWSIPPVEGFPEEVHNRAVFIVVALYSGDAQEGQRILQPLREQGDMVLDLSGVYPYTDVQQFYDPLFPSGQLRCYWKSLRLDNLDDEVMDTLIGYGKNRPSPRTLLALWHHGGTENGGAMGRVEPTETAFGDRSARYLFSFDTTWIDPAEDEVNINWTRDCWNDLHRFSSGGLYLNFPGMGEEGESLVQAAYGGNYDRLAEIKAKYDPENLFHINQNIRPRCA